MDTKKPRKGEGKNISRRGQPQLVKADAGGTVVQGMTLVLYSERPEFES